MPIFELSTPTPRWARALQAFVLFAASAGTATTPVASSVSVETYARICSDSACTVVLAEEAPLLEDSQLSSLGPFSVLADAAVTSSLGSQADASMEIETRFDSASSGFFEFRGDVGASKPIGSSPHTCQATNNLSDGFAYTFVASANGFLTIDYAVGCTPTSEVNFCSGLLDFYLDGAVLPDPVRVTTVNPNSLGTSVVPITLGATHTLEIQPLLGSIGSGVGCSSPGEFSWSLMGNASWSFDSAPEALVSYTFSGRAFADPALVSGQVPAEVQAFLDGQGLEGAWFAASFSFDDSTMDSDPILESATYRNAVVDSELSFGPLRHEAIEFCNEDFLDCSIFVDDDLPFFGSLKDEYILRARNLRVLGIPQVLIPGTDILVNAFDLNSSFLMQATELSLGQTPTLLEDTGIGPDLEEIFSSGTHDIILTYFGTGPAGAYSLGYRVENPFFVPEPSGSLWVMIGFFVVVLSRRNALGAPPQPPITISLRVRSRVAET